MQKPQVGPAVFLKSTNTHLLKVAHTSVMRLLRGLITGCNQSSATAVLPLASCSFVTPQLQTPSSALPGMRKPHALHQLPTVGQLPVYVQWPATSQKPSVSLPGPPTPPPRSSESCVGSPLPSWLLHGVST